jgi:hypothetical protein
LNGHWKEISKLHREANHKHVLEKPSHMSESRIQTIS